MSSDPMAPLLREWLESRAATPSPDPLARALDRIAATPQRRAWGGRVTRGADDTPARRRSLAMITPTRLVALVAVLTVGAGAFLFAGGPTPPPDRSPSPAPSAAPSPVTGRTIVLAADGTGDVDDLTRALVMADAGDTILVRPGTYPALRPALTGDITIVGDGPREDVVLEMVPGRRSWSTPDGGGIEGGGGLFILGGSPTLASLTVRVTEPTDVAILVASPGVAAVLRDVTVEGGLRVMDGGSATIEGSEVRLGPGEGEYPPTAAIAASDPGTNVAILETGVRSTADGVIAGYGATVTVDGGTIAASATAVEINDASGAIRSSRVEGSETGIRVSFTGGEVPVLAVPEITGNTLSGNGTAIELDGCAEPSLVDNTMEGNDVGLRIADCQVMGPEGVDGPWRVEGNTICGNGVDVQAGPAIDLPTAGNTICTAGASPGPVVASPSATPSWPALTLVTEPIQPDVERVRVMLGDQELLPFTENQEVVEVEVGPDGAVWLAGSGHLIRLGGGASPIERPLPYAWISDLTLTPDGAAWMVTGGQLARFDGSDWTAFAAPARGVARQVEAGPDVSVIAIWTDADGNDARVSRLEGDAWVILRAPPGGSHLALTRDGSVWVAAESHHSQPPPDWLGLARLGEGGWSGERPVVPGLDLQTGPVIAGPDGSLWIYATACELDGELSMSRASWCAAETATYRPFLARFDGSEWRVFSDADGVPMLEGFQTWGSALAVAPDGTLWIGLTGGGDRADLGPGCAGVLSFDGEAWAQYLKGVCVTDLGIGPDGTVWASSHGNAQADPRDAGLYRIRPRG